MAGLTPKMISRHLPNPIWSPIRQILAKGHCNWITFPISAVCGFRNKRVFSHLTTRPDLDDQLETHVFIESLQVIFCFQNMLTSKQQSNCCRVRHKRCGRGFSGKSDDYSDLIGNLMSRLQGVAYKRHIIFCAFVLTSRSNPELKFSTFTSIMMRLIVIAALVAACLAAQTKQPQSVKDCKVSVCCFANDAVFSIRATKFVVHGNGCA